MKRIIKKIGKYLLCTLLVVSSYIIADMCLTESVLSDSFIRGSLFNLLGLLCLVPYYYIIFRLGGLIKTDKEYKDRIKYLEDEIFNTNLNKDRELAIKESELRGVRKQRDFLHNELTESKRQLQKSYDKEDIWEMKLKEAQEETIEAKAKYVELVNNRYREEKLR